MAQALMNTFCKNPLKSRAPKGSLVVFKLEHFKEDKNPYIYREPIRYIIKCVLSRT